MANRRLILCRFISLPSLVSSVYSLSTHTHGMCIHLNWQSSKEKGGEKRKAINIKIANLNYTINYTKCNELNILIIRQIR